jgi:hypothetical protein
MSKKNENLALKNQLKIMTSYSIQHERLDFMEIGLCHEVQNLSKPKK